MPVTRDADFPTQVAQLFQALNHCADGHDINDVIEAAANFLVAAIVNNAQMRGHCSADVNNTAQEVCEGVRALVRKNFGRESRSTDIPVQTN